MAGRHGPHPITTTDELLELVIDELRGLRADLAASAPASPESSAPEPQEPIGEGSVEVDIREPVTKSTRARTVKIAEPAGTAGKTLAKHAPSKEK